MIREPMARTRGANYLWGVYLSDLSDAPPIYHLYGPPRPETLEVPDRPEVLKVTWYWKAACNPDWEGTEVPTWRENQPYYERGQLLCRPCWNWARS